MMNHARVFKKTAPNGKLTIYVERRELSIDENGIEPLQGVLLIDLNYVKDRKVFGQFVLTFRYGREDEEVMGLRFCNEACLHAFQLWPKQPETNSKIPLTPLQETLVKRLGGGAVAFSFTISSLAPPSVTLLPARTYTGAPIGTNYDLRIFVGESPEEKPHKRSSIRMGMKLYQLASISPSLQPYASFSKQLLLTEGQVSVEATLNKEVYQRDEPVCIDVTITNSSSRSVKKIKVFIVQYVDVAMFSNGKFKNVVASLESTEGFPVAPGSCHTSSYQLNPLRGIIKNWIALEEFYDKESNLASSVIKPPNTERNVFAIYVSYYVKVKLLTSALGGEVSVKVPFRLMRVQSPIPEQPCTSSDITQRRLIPNQGSPLNFSQSMCDLSGVNCLTDLRRSSTASRRRPLSARSKSEDSITFKTSSQPHLDVPFVTDASFLPRLDEVLHQNQTTVDVHTIASSSSNSHPVTRVDLQAMEENLATVCKIIEKTGESERRNDFRAPEEEVFITSKHKKILIKGNG